MTLGRTVGAWLCAGALVALPACASDSDDASSQRDPRSETSDPELGATCGGFIGALCADDEYCDFPKDNCGVADQTGTCKPRSEVCTDIFAPVCGCDGKVYGNACVASSEGTDVAAAGGCSVAPG